MVLVVVVGPRRVRAKAQPTRSGASVTVAAVRVTRHSSAPILLLVVETVVARAGILVALPRRVATTRLNRRVQVLARAQVALVQAVAVVAVVAPVGAVVMFRVGFPLLWTFWGVFPLLWTLSVPRFDRVWAICAVPLTNRFRLVRGRIRS